MRNDEVNKPNILLKKISRSFSQANRNIGKLQRRTAIPILASDK